MTPPTPQTLEMVLVATTGERMTIHLRKVREGVYEIERVTPVDYPKGDERPT